MLQKKRKLLFLLNNIFAVRRLAFPFVSDEAKETTSKALGQRIAFLFCSFYTRREGYQKQALSSIAVSACLLLNLFIFIFFH